MRERTDTVELTFDNPENLKHRSDAVVFNGLAFISGALASDVSADIAGQTTQFWRSWTSGSRVRAPTRATFFPPRSG